MHRIRWHTLGLMGHRVRQASGLFCCSCFASAVLSLPGHAPQHFSPVSAHRSAPGCIYSTRAGISAAQYVCRSFWRSRAALAHLLNWVTWESSSLTRSRPGQKGCPRSYNPLHSAVLNTKHQKSTSGSPTNPKLGEENKSQQSLT